MLLNENLKFIAQGEFRALNFKLLFIRSTFIKILLFFMFFYSSIDDEFEFC